ncbi:MAG TPA: glycosyltransferase family 39 protein [Chitinophagaceae bacterium]|nr:glycosyltransferase family 39 protein [Chitinophagaceae bacterium]
MRNPAAGARGGPSLILFYLLYLTAAILLFTRLGSPSLYILDEVKNAQCAREMMHNANHWIPVFNGVLRTDKPPVHYFFMQLAYHLFGVNALAARFFSALAGLGTLMLIGSFARRFLDRFSSFFTILALVTCTHFLFEFRLAVPDPYLIFFTTLTFTSAFRWLEEGAPAELYLAAFGAGMAVLAKGPVGILLPGLCLLIWMGWKGKFRTLVSWHLPGALLLFLLLALPWYLLVDRATAGEWTRGFFLEHNLSRFTRAREGHGGIFLLVPAFFLVGLLPFSPFIPASLRQLRHHPNKAPLQFAILIVIVYLLFFSISRTKLPNYAMPCYPMAAVLIGAYLGRAWQGTYRVPGYLFWILAVISLLIPAGAFLGIRSEMQTADLAPMAWLLGITPLTMTGILLSPQKSLSARLTWTALGWTALNLVGLLYLYPAIYVRNPVSQTIQQVKSAPAVLGYRIINPAYLFYLDHPVRVTENPDTLRHWLDMNPGAIVITRSAFGAELRGLPLRPVASLHNLFETDTTALFEGMPAPRTPGAGSH